MKKLSDACNQHEGCFGGKTYCSRDECRESEHDPSRGYGWEEGVGKSQLVVKFQRFVSDQLTFRFSPQLVVKF